MKWGESRVRTLCLTMQSLNRKTIPLMLPHTKGCVLSLALTQVLIFALHMGKNHGLGYVNIMYSDGAFARKKWKYPPADLSNKSSQRFSDEGGKDDDRNK